MQSTGFKNTIADLICTSPLSPPSSPSFGLELGHLIPIRTKTLPTIESIQDKNNLPGDPLHKNSIDRERRRQSLKTSQLKTPYSSPSATYYSESEEDSPPLVNAQALYKLFCLNNRARLQKLEPNVTNRTISRRLVSIWSKMSKREKKRLARQYGMW